MALRKLTFSLKRNRRFWVTQRERKSVQVPTRRAEGAKAEKESLRLKYISNGRQIAGMHARCMAHYLLKTKGNTNGNIFTIFEIYITGIIIIQRERKCPTYMLLLF